MSKNGAGFGTAPYQGYEYQIHVTVWLALNLIVELSYTDKIIIEPATGEDVSAELAVDPDTSSSNLEIPLVGGLLEVQIKRKSTGAWSVSEFAKMVSGEDPDPYASKLRTWPIVSLNKRNDYRYVMITNTTVAQNLKPYVLEKILYLSDAKALPTSFVKGMDFQQPDIIASRIGILELQDITLINYKIRELLHRKAYVPHGNIEDCLLDLISQVRARMLGIYAREWSREDIETTLRKYEGFPNVPEEVDNFIPPSSYPKMTQFLEQNHALLLSGPPGVGKTIAANSLVYRHQTMDPPFTVVTEVANPAEIGRLIQQPGRYLFYLSDPWGQSQLEENAAKWTAELPKLLSRAGKDKRFLITTRTAIQNEANAAEHFQFTSITMMLLPEHYQIDERRKMLWLHAGEISSELKDFLTVHQRQILKSLLVPLSISEFVHRLKRININEMKKYLQRLLEQSNVDAISRTVQQELSGLEWEAKPGAILMWSLFAVDRNPSESLLQIFIEAIQGTDPSQKLHIRKLINWLIEAQWLKKESSRYNAHPTVVKGLELIVGKEPDLTVNVTSALLKGVCVVDRKLTFELLKYFKGRVEGVPAKVLDGVNSYLRSVVLEADNEHFSKALSNLVRWSSNTNDPVVMLGKAIYRGEQYGGKGFKRWKIPALSAEAVGLISASEDCRYIMSNFITYLLPKTSVLYDFSFLSFIQMLGWEMADSFLNAVPSLLMESSFNDKLIIAGALSGPQPPYENLLSLALRELRDAEQWYDGFQDSKREAEQAEIDASYASYVYEQPSERFSPILGLIREILKIRRHSEGYEWIVRHPFIEDLLDEWATVTEVEEVTDQELIAMLDVCRAINRTDAYKVIAKLGRKTLVPALIADFNKLNFSEFYEFMELFMVLCDDKQWEKVALLVKKVADFPQRANLAFKFRKEITRYEFGARMLTLFKPVEAETISLCLMVFHDDQDKLPSEVSDENLVLLKHLSEKTTDLLAICATYVLCLYGQDVQALLARLAGSSDYVVKINVIRLLSYDDSPDTRKLIRQFLHDSDYRCRRTAMQALIPTSNIEEKMSLLEMASDRSAPVRSELALILKEHIWDEGIPTLISLLGDTRNFGDQGYTYKVARDTVQALLSYPAISQTYINDILDFATKEISVNQDIEFCYQLIDLISRFRHEMVPKVLYSCLENYIEMIGLKNEGFPIRYAGAWGYVHQIVETDYEPSDVELNALIEGALHHDNRLAGPCLISLGCAKNLTRTYVRTLLPKLSGEALTLLFVAAKFSDNQAVSEDLLNGYRADLDDSGMLFIEWWLRHQLPSKEDWEDFIVIDRVSSWLKKIKEEDGLGLSICFLIQLMCGDSVEDTLFPNARKNDLAESISIMNLRTMAGGE
ncbi:hypothetical protein YWY31_32200 [Paenibacillus illinoisensis]|uniref:HEAT repeat domain-containing protein n=1 Tax=Paenibacillus illinoisensis TaxID=59845 RepID=UPI0034B35701